MPGVTEFDARRIRQILQADVLTEAEFTEVRTLGRMGGELPPADGVDESGKFWWRNATVTAWLRGELEQKAIRTRAGLTSDLQRRRGGKIRLRRPRTWDDETRTCRAVITSETPCPIFSPTVMDYVDEVLLADGMTVDSDSVPLQRDHDWSLDATVGRAYDFTQIISEWEATLEFIEGEEADKVRDGLIDSVSIGYLVLDSVTIPAGESGLVAGRTFRAGPDRPLLVATSWRLVEVSLVPIPADPRAKIRSQQSFQTSRSSSMSSVAIHSRHSVTGRPTVGALVSAALLQARVSDPSRRRAAIGAGGELISVRASIVTERDADLGQAYANLPPHMLIRHALELDGHRPADYLPNTIMRAAWLAAQRGSAANLTALYQGVFGSLMLSGWDAAGDSTLGWVGEADSLTYQRQPASRLSAAELSLQAKGGVAEDLDIEVVAESTQVARYSAKFTLDEQDIINASTQGGLLLDTAIGKQLGAAARALRPNLVYATLLRNPVMEDGLPLFHADHANMQGGDLDDNGLTATMGLIGRQEENGVKLNLRGDYLIVPVEQERPAGKLVAEVSTGDDEATRPPIVRSDSRLDNGLKDPLTGETHEGSDTRFYMASREAGHGLEVRYLAGTGRMPIVSVGLLSDGQFGVGIAISHTIGVVTLGYRGLAVCDVEST